MAEPSYTEVIDDVASTTLENIIPSLIDNVFLSNALAVRLRERDHILLDGGRDVRQPILFGKMPRGFYHGLGKFNTERVQTKTALIFQWKQLYANVTIDGLTELQNSGAEAIIDVAEAEAQTAELSLSDMMGYSIYRDPGTAYTDTDGTVLWTAGNIGFTGLETAIDDGTNFGSYGGVTRDTSAQGTAVKGNYDGTGGVTTLDLIVGDWGNAVIEPEKPDLLVTTQTIWNKIWSRLQPQQRFPTGPGFDDVARAGFRVLDLNGMAVVVDSHVQAGRAYGLNTKFIKMIFHKNRLFKKTPWKYPTDQDARVCQILAAGELVVQSPRLCFEIRNLT